MALLRNFLTERPRPSYRPHHPHPVPPGDHMNLTNTDLATMRQALVDLRSQIDETGPMRPPRQHLRVRAPQHLRIPRLPLLPHDRRAGRVHPGPQFIDLEQFTRNILGIKPDADSANASFRKGTINDHD
jgi:hypothetical protein